MRCDFGRLALLMDGKLPLDEKLELFDHLDNCEACFDQIYRIWKQLDRRFLRSSLICLDELEIL